jgi:hypothetical protein
VDQVTDMNTLLCKEPCSTQYYYYILTSLFSILLMLTVVQLASGESASASEILQNESLVVDNNITSTNNLSSSGESPDSFPKIHTHTSGEKGIFVNGYLVENANGVVVIDSALTVSESKALKAQLDSINKPLLAILLTHPHPLRLDSSSLFFTISAAFYYDVILDISS